MTGTREQAAPRKAPVDASMTLLNEVMHRPLDPGYAAAAARRAAGHAPRRTPSRVALVAVLAVTLGVLTTAATLDLRAPQPDALAARTLLEDEITSRQGDADALAARATDLSAQVESLQAEALAGISPALLAQIQSDGLETGTVAVKGPGLVVTLIDAPPGSDGTTDPEATVQDSDVQHVVNALWSGGAEAIAINDHRLTTLSAIRSAGSAILVDLQPLVGPYRVQAIGDAEAMQVGLARSGASDLLRLLGTRYGIRSSVTEQSSLDLPATPSPTLFYARPVEGP